MSRDLLGDEGRCMLEACVKVTVVGKPEVRSYSIIDAKRRIFSCYSGSWLGGLEMLPVERDARGVPVSMSPTYDINDIHAAITRIDASGRVRIYPEVDPPPVRERQQYDEAGREIYYSELTRRQRIDQNRENIRREFEEANVLDEVEHGSGFFISNHFILTNAHVIETAQCDAGYKVRVGNRTIPVSDCDIVHCDYPSDLALLYCAGVNFSEQGVIPMELHDEPLLAGMSVFTFGYPISHTGDTALFVNGYVAGEKTVGMGASERKLAVLNCPLNSGNSGGPVLCWVDDRLQVVGVANQKHAKAILTYEERSVIDRIRETMQTTEIADSRSSVGGIRGVDSPDPKRDPLDLLTIKLYDALGTHTQFNLSNAIPAATVLHFLQSCNARCNPAQRAELGAILPGAESSTTAARLSGHPSSLMPRASAAGAASSTAAGPTLDDDDEDSPAP